MRLEIPEALGSEPVASSSLLSQQPGVSLTAPNVPAELRDRQRDQLRVGGASEGAGPGPGDRAPGGRAGPGADRRLQPARPEGEGT